MNHDVFIEELRGRDWRVLWLGGCRQPIDGTSPLEVEVIFVEDPIPLQRKARWEAKYRPIEELGLYGVQALWRDGRLVGYDRHKHPVKTLTVLPTPTRMSAPGWSEPPFSDSEYSLHGRKFAAACWTFGTEEGDELVVPGWQILHAWYLFDPLVVPCVIGGMLDPTQNYGVRTPWLPGTKVDDGHVTFVTTPEFAESPYNAKALSRILFEPSANRSARMIHKLLMDSRKRLPMIWPPHRDPAKWTFRARPLLPLRNGRNRWLLLHIQGADIPLPFSGFDLITKSVSKGMPEDLSPSIAKTGLPSIKDKKSVALIGGRRGARRSTQSSFPALGFIDKAVEDLSVTRRSVTEESQAAIGVSIILPDPELQVEAASMTTLGPEDKRVLDVRPRSPQKEAEDSATLFRRTRSAFQAVIEYLCVQPNPLGHSWSGCLINSGSDDCFVHGYSNKRSFLVLEVQIAGLYTYIVDVRRELGDAEFPLVMIRRVGAGVLNPEHLHFWLRDFPFSGSEPWGGGTDLPRWLMKPMHIPHQTTQLPADIEALPQEHREREADLRYIRLFRNRLVRRVTQYEELQIRESNRVRRHERQRKL